MFTWDSQVVLRVNTYRCKWIYIFDETVKIDQQDYFWIIRDAHIASPSSQIFWDQPSHLFIVFPSSGTHQPTLGFTQQEKPSQEHHWTRIIKLSSSQWGIATTRPTNRPQNPQNPQGWLGSPVEISIPSPSPAENHGAARHLRDVFGCSQAWEGPPPVHHSHPLTAAGGAGSTGWTIVIYAGKVEYEVLVRLGI